MLKELLRHGAKPVGDPRGCHAVALDARAPKFDGGIVTRLDSVPFGIVVNKEVKRFYDEGEDFWPKRYAIWGKLIAEQPEQIAYSIIDAKAMPHFMPSVFPPVEAGSIAELARGIGNRCRSALVAVVDEFNRSVRAGRFDPGSLDDCRTEGLDPPKSHWAQAHRHAALLRLSAAAGHYVYLSRRYRERAGAGDHAKRSAGEKYFRRGRGDGRKHSRQRLSGRIRFDHRFGVRANRRAGGGALCRILIWSKTARGR